MTPYEHLRRLLLPVLPVLHGRAHRDLRRLLVERRSSGVGSDRLSLLDVGGRNSPYTVGLPARVTIVDLPRTSELQGRLHLGLSEELTERLRRRRSNVERVVLEDMTRSTLPGASFAGAVAVEVIEHVADDDAFVAQVSRVVEPGGFAYLTTPNGEWVKNEPPYFNPDHLRHYTRAELADLLGRHFDEVEVVYAVRTGRARSRGLRPFTPRRPLRLLGTCLANLQSHWQSRGLDEVPRRTAHLVAVARRRP